MKSWKTIVFTSPGKEDQESSKIRLLLEGGVDLVHIRKPDWSREEVRTLIKDIPEYFHPRLKIHDHFSLTDEFQIGGVHLNRRNPYYLGRKCEISRSCHTIEEVEESINDGLSYVTLSPIFDSISKSAYLSGHNLEKISLPPKNGLPVIALGGVTPDKFRILAEAGFAGAALLGAIWTGDFRQNVLLLSKAIKEMNNSPIGRRLTI